MNNNMPRTPFSTHLSRSAKETEIRIRNIFSGPKKRPPIPLMILVAAVCIFCGNLVSCQVRPKEPTLVMETQYYDSYANYLEIPMLALPAGEENEAVDAINAGLAELGARYERLKINEGVSQRCTLYPSTTGRYINLVFFEDLGDYGNDGYVRSWVYDKKEGTQVTEEDAFALAGTTREELFSELEQLIAADPEDPRELYKIGDPINLQGFRIKADGQPVLYLTAVVNGRELENGGYLDEWARLYIWDEGEFSRYSWAIWAEGQYPLVPAEETDKLDPPLWCQWFFAGEEPEGGFVDKSLLEPAADLYDPEVCLYRDGFSTPIGPGNWAELFPEFEPEVTNISNGGWRTDPQSGRTESWSIDGGGEKGGVSAERSYDAETDRYTLLYLVTGRSDMYTPRGIRVGSTREEVLAAYPGLLSDEQIGSWFDYDYLWYSADKTVLPPRLYFHFNEDDVVCMIQMRVHYKP